MMLFIYTLPKDLGEFSPSQTSHGSPYGLYPGQMPI